MKNMQRLIAWIGIAACSYLPTAYAITPDAGSGNTKVSFANSERFTDIQTSSIRSERDEMRVLAAISDTFRKEADRVLPSGYTLEVNVSDIDLAGDRSLIPPGFGEYRIFKDIYPPRITFSYTVRDPSEVVVADGEARLSNLSYLQSVQIPTSKYSDETAHTKDLIRDWANGTLKNAIATAAK